jgi:hypothetical protein
MPGHDAHRRHLKAVTERVRVYEGVWFVALDRFEDALGIQLSHHVSAFRECHRERSFHAATLSYNGCGSLANRGERLVDFGA